MNFRTKVILFVVCLVALLVLQYKVIMPAVYKVVSSDLFLKDDDSNSDLNSIADQMQGYAFDQCNNYIANTLDADEMSASFVSKPVNSWSIDTNQFVINADIDLIPANAPSFTRRYVCRIKYTTDSSDFAETSNPDNWSVDGISGLDNLEP